MNIIRLIFKDFQIGMVIQWLIREVASQRSECVDLYLRVRTESSAASFSVRRFRPKYVKTDQGTLTTVIATNGSIYSTNFRI